MARDRVRLTKAYIDNIPLPPPGKRVEVFDSVVPDLCIRVTPKGTKTFSVYRRLKGKTAKRYTIGKYPLVTPEKARTRAKDPLTTMADGTNPNDLERAERAVHEATGKTLREVFASYQQTRDLKASTVADYRESLETSFPDWLDKPMTEITERMVQDRHAKRSKVSKARANHAMRVLRALFNHLSAKYKDEGGNPVVSHNPVKTLSELRQWNRIKRRKTLIEPQDLPKWFKAVQTLEAERENRVIVAESCRDFLITLILTGLREMEAKTLKWSEVNLEAGTLTILETKNGEPHRLPVADYLLTILRRRKKAAKSDYVFPGTAKAGHLGTTVGWIEKVASKSGVSFCLHDLRRTFATIAESLDLSGFTIKRLLNHNTDADVTGGYITLTDQRLRDAMQRIETEILERGDVGRN